MGTARAVCESHFIEWRNLTLRKGDFKMTMKYMKNFTATENILKHDV
jgi:hypothetical protein